MIGSVQQEIELDSVFDPEASALKGEKAFYGTYRVSQDGRELFKGRTLMTYPSDREAVAAAEKTARESLARF